MTIVQFSCPAHPRWDSCFQQETAAQFQTCLQLTQYLPHTLSAEESGPMTAHKRPLDRSASWGCQRACEPSSPEKIRAPLCASNKNRLKRVKVKPAQTVQVRVDEDSSLGRCCWVLQQDHTCCVLGGHQSSQAPHTLSSLHVRRDPAHTCTEAPWLQPRLLLIWVRFFISEHPI